MMEPMPPSKGTQVRTVRADSDLWDAVLAAAEAEGISASEYVRRAIRERLDREGES